MKPFLSLEVSMEQSDSFSGLGNTYRNEGLSVGTSQMRFQGSEIPMEVTFSELSMGNVIGQGACSSVNVAVHKDTGVPYAVKMFNVYDESQASQLFKEISMLSSVQDCDALISLKGAFHQEGQIGMIIEFMDQGSLEFMVNEDVTETVVAATFYQILWGLGYLHFDNRLHRDIKPGNVLVNSWGQVKLSDFGIAKALDSSTAMSSTAVGTFKYMSPERLLGEEYDKSGDIWSVGIMLVELWTKRYPFYYCAGTPVDLISELESLDVTQFIPKDRYPKLMRTVVISMLHHDPVDRATCGDLIGGKWFRDMGVTNLTAAQEIVADWLRIIGRRGRQIDAASDSKGYGSGDEFDVKSQFRSSRHEGKYDDDFESEDMDLSGSFHSRYGK